MVDILDKTKDLAPYFGIDCDDPSAESLWRIQSYVESSAKKFVRHGIVQQEYTEFQRHDNIGLTDFDSGDFELIGDTVYSTQHTQHYGQVLQLNNGFVRSVSNVYEDASAYFGQRSGDFPASSELTSGTDFYMELDNAGISKSGRLIRVSRGWSTKPGTIKVVYTAGFAASELDGEYSFVKMALLEEMRERFNVARSQQNSAFGRLKKVTYFGDYQEEYAVDAKVTVLSQLSMSTMNALQAIKHIDL